MLFNELLFKKLVSESPKNIDFLLVSTVDHGFRPFCFNEPVGFDFSLNLFVS